MTEQLRIPLFVPPEIRNEQLSAALAEAIGRVIESGRYILGREVEEFERKAAQFVGTQYCVGVSSGTDALVVMLEALGIGKGHEVVLPAYTFAATAEAVLRVGATPVFVDIGDDLLIDANLLTQAITPKTKAVLAVSLFGAEPDWSDIQSAIAGQNLALLIDAAQSFGLGSMHHRYADKPWQIATTSFFPSKTLGALGDAGAIFCNDASLAETARQLRVHGKTTNGRFLRLGGNYRLDTVQAAALLVKLPFVEMWNTKRQKAAQTYITLLKEAGLLDKVSPVVCKPQSYFVVRIPRYRDAVRSCLADRGIATAIYYAHPLPKEPLFAEYRCIPPDLPMSHKAANETLALPFFPDITKSEQEAVVAALKHAFDTIDRRLRCSTN